MGTTPKERRTQNVALALAVLLLVAIGFAGRIESALARWRGVSADAGLDAGSTATKRAPLKRAFPKEKPAEAVSGAATIPSSEAPSTEAPPHEDAGH